ncbi:hypothetical protein PSA7680_01589 [Pseudoruegeria aquimaris]|uniref:Lipoprotein n=1 Tax=Pseudoruegeria aquimaris TaxID=393663 RepID=A0A1Y5S763_9RHOB|nr:hypothetical protein [Pseudoruegeria aquimaris]SLN33740.1 hypothetical protein PSA7680_01589 [Pseudoruegeria aquimaris]
MSRKAFISLGILAALAACSSNSQIPNSNPDAVNRSRNGAPQVLAVVDMPAFCRGAVSDTTTVDATSIRTTEAALIDGRYEVNVTVPRGEEIFEYYQCTFGGDGSFQQMVPTGAPGVAEEPLL